jgi:hypothetical protein
VPNPPFPPRGFGSSPIGARLTDLIEARVGLHAWCKHCRGETRPVDTRKLARRHGDLTPLNRIESKLRCSTCRRYDATFHVRTDESARIPRYR